MKKIYYWITQVICFAIGGAGFSLVSGAHQQLWFWIPLLILCILPYLGCKLALSLAYRRFARQFPGYDELVIKGMWNCEKEKRAKSSRWKFLYN